MKPIKILKAQSYSLAAINNAGTFETVDHVFLLLGSNLGDAFQHLKNAEQAIAQIGKVKKVSSVYQTEAWGKNDQPDFLNQVLQISYAGTPRELLHEVLKIEQELGREREIKWGPRIIDIDILFFGNQIFDDTDLIIPHPELHNRRFTLTPLFEIAPEFIHPRLNKTIRALLNECPDMLEVKLFKG